jgi:hypothetical protein
VTRISCLLLILSENFHCVRLLRSELEECVVHWSCCDGLLVVHTTKRRSTQLSKVQAD